MAYEKTSQAWKELDEKISAEIKAQFDAIDEEEDREKRSAARAKLWGNRQETIEQLQEKEKEFQEAAQKLYTLAEEIATLTEHSAGFRIRWIRRYTGTLNSIVREHLPKIFHFPQEDMDKVIRAMEMDRRTEARMSTLEGMPYEQYLQTHEWEMRRNQALQDAKNHCQMCNSVKRLDVHHKTYRRRGHELPEDLIVLCHDCHSKFHDKIGENSDPDKVWVQNQSRKFRNRG